MIGALIKVDDYIAAGNLTFSEFCAVNTEAHRMSEDASFAGTLAAPKDAAAARAGFR